MGVLIPRRNTEENITQQAAGAELRFSTDDEEKKKRREEERKRRAYFDVGWKIMSARWGLVLVGTSRPVTDLVQSGARVTCEREVLSPAHVI